MMRPLHGALGDQGKETAQPQIRDDDHHPEQEDDGVPIDGPVGLFQREYIRRDHEARADNGGPGPVYPEAWEPADRDNHISP